MTDIKKALDDELNSPEFKHGLVVGESLGRYYAAADAKAAHEAGEIELWIDLQTPKSLENWDIWEKEHGKISQIRKRWGLPPLRQDDSERQED